MKRLTLVIGFFIFLSNLGIGQTLRAFEKAAANSFAQKDYYAALEYYSVILEVENDRPDIWYKFAESARNFEALEIAEEYYQKVSKHDLRSNFPLTNYWLGDVKKRLGKYDEAKLYFEYYLNQTAIEKKYIALAQKGIEECTWGMELVKTPDPGIKIQVLDNSVNSPYSEFAPLQRGDTLYYSSMRFENTQDIHRPPRQISKMMMRVGSNRGSTMKGRLNFDHLHTANAAFNPSGNRFYYTVCQNSETNEIVCRIFVRQLQNDGKWGQPEKLSEAINQSGYTTTHPSIGVDKNGREILYYVSDCPGGMGGLDVWYSVQDENGQFTNPQNLSAINTAYNEITPFWNQGEKALYFSSNGHKGLGGYDIFKSAFSNDVWSEPVHLGVPLNTGYNEMYYSVNPEGTLAYFSSNREGARYLEKSKKACCNDIFSAKLNDSQFNIQLLVFDAENKQSLPGVTVTLKEAPDHVVLAQNNKESNDFHFPLEVEKLYIQEISRPGYLPDTIMISTQGLIRSKIFNREVFLKPVAREKAPPLFLQALTYDAISKKPLSGATIELINEKKEGRTTLTNKGGNDFTFEVERNFPYKIKVTRDGYQPVIQNFSPENIKLSYTFERQLFLYPLSPTEVSRLTLSDYLPLGVYFDNDQPKASPLSDYTNKSYSEFFNNYQSKKNRFIRENRNSNSDVENYEAIREIEAFFEQDVQLGYANLISFSNQLLQYLKAGNQAELLIKGYASPRADNNYNIQLTKRRIASLENHFKTFQDGVLIPYLKSGQLVISQQPLGESRSPNDVSDEIDDPVNSIYSVKASKERRVEIIEIN